MGNRPLRRENKTPIGWMQALAVPNARQQSYSRH